MRRGDKLPLDPISRPVKSAAEVLVITPALHLLPQRISKKLTVSQSLCVKQTDKIRVYRFASTSVAYKFAGFLIDHDVPVRVVSTNIR